MSSEDMIEAGQNRKMASTAKYRSIFAALFLASLVGDAAVAATPPCTDEMAWEKPGSWSARGEDDLAMADRSYPKAQYPVAFAKADRVVALLRQAIPNLNGVEARSYRSIRGASYTKNGALKYGVNALFRGYYCVPDTPSFPQVRGQIRLGDETGTWIYVDFNNFSWLANDKLRVQGDDLYTKSGRVFFYFPKQDGEWKGLPLLSPILFRGNAFQGMGYKDEAVIIAPPGRPPYRFITREEFLEARARQVRRKLEILAERERNPRSARIPPPDGRGRAQRENELQRIEAALAALSPAERKAEAIVSNPHVIPGDAEKVFTTEAEGGRRVFIITRNFFDKSLPRHAVQFITVYWKWDVGSNSTAKARVIRQFKENLDVPALRALLDR
jgi:hypothetical protein